MKGYGSAKKSHAKPKKKKTTRKPAKKAKKMKY